MILMEMHGKKDEGEKECLLSYVKKNIGLEAGLVSLLVFPYMKCFDV